MLTERFVSALRFAVEVHEGDVRKGTEIPYVSHLLQVAGLVLEFGGNEDQAIGGLLHDAAEDAGGEAMLLRIRQEFGEIVESIVRENSDSITDSKAEKAPWRERKEKYIAGIASKSQSALLVSICDKIHNVRSLVSDSCLLGESHWERFNASKEDSLWYYHALSNEFGIRAKEDCRLENATRLLGLALIDLMKSDQACSNLSSN